ncbi:MAG: substrate-binding domain-containing protein [Oscillospiraceae bacterium]|nr:substrate-binding domain-containing protein [Oscillospiraceae bacterium]
MKTGRILTIITMLLALCLTMGMVTACDSTDQVSVAPPATEGNQPEETQAEVPASNFNSNEEIVFVTREAGSGTRGAFIELFEIEVRLEDGSRTDTTSPEAQEANSTGVMLTTVQSDAYTIGYASLGSVNDSVKVIEIDGVLASQENIVNGSYAIQRPFNIATNGEATGLAKDFIDFIFSAEGQDIIADRGYIKINEDATAFEGELPEGRIVIAGSSSVSPVMLRLKEAYEALNPNAQIELQETDSTAGMNALIDGICDIGMASRDLKDNEREVLTDMAIAIDGIAVIVNNQNPVTGLTSEQVKNIYTGETSVWNEIIG